MTLRLDRLDEPALLTLDRPQALNALNAETLREFDRALGEVAASDARALLVAGAGGRAFCAGADIAELAGRSLRAARALEMILSGRAVGAEGMAAFLAKRKPLVRDR
jgi:enoyl-CoA hydratase